MKVIYETERLVIRQWEKEDYQDLFEYASNPEASKFLKFTLLENKVCVPITIFA